MFLQAKKQNVRQVMRGNIRWGKQDIKVTKGAACKIVKTVMTYLTRKGKGWSLGGTKERKRQNFPNLRNYLVSLKRGRPLGERKRRKKNNWKMLGKRGDGGKETRDKGEGKQGEKKQKGKKYVSSVRRWTSTRGYNFFGRRFFSVHT